MFRYLDTKRQGAGGGPHIRDCQRPNCGTGGPEQTLPLPSISIIASETIDHPRALMYVSFLHQFVFVVDVGVGFVSVKVGGGGGLVEASF